MQPWLLFLQNEGKEFETPYGEKFVLDFVRPNYLVVKYLPDGLKYYKHFLIEDIVIIMAWAELKTQGNESRRFSLHELFAPLCRNRQTLTAKFAMGLLSLIPGIGVSKGPFLYYKEEKNGS